MQQADAWVIVGTKLDTKQLEKDLKLAHRELKQYEKEAERLTKTKAKSELDLQAYEEQKRLIREGTDEFNQMAQTQAEVNHYMKMEEKELRALDIKYAEQIQNLENVNKKIQENAKNQALVKNEIDETNEKLRQAKTYDNIKDIIGNIGKSTTDVIKKIGKWALAIFSVRSAYMLVRQSISTISRYNEKLASDIEYIRYAVAMTLEKTIISIVELVYKLLQYVNYISWAWFKVNLFANSSSDAFNKANNNANKLKKTLAGFDEMNILGDQNNSNANLPSFDLSQIATNVPWWVDWIAKNKELFSDITKGLLVLFGVTTTTKVLNGIAKIMGASGGMGLIGLKETLAIIGTTYVVYFAVKGLVQLINQVKELNEQLDSLNRQSKLNQENNKKNEKTFFDLAKQGKLTKEQIESYHAMLDDSFEISRNYIESLEEQKTWFGAITDQNEKLTEAQKIEFETMKQNLEIYSKMYDQGMLNVDQQKQYKDALEKTIEFLENQGVEVEQLKNHYQNLTGKPYELKIKAVADTSQADKDFSNFFTKMGQSIGSILSPSSWKKGLGSELKSIWTGKKLAVGGIVNMPGKGVPIGGALTGEVTKEGVIPLTDAQAMQELGQTIGRYITVNNHITTTLNGRVIGRELQKSNNESNFAFNN